MGASGASGGRCASSGGLDTATGLASGMEGGVMQNRAAASPAGTALGGSERTGWECGRADRSWPQLRKLSDVASMPPRSIIAILDDGGMATLRRRSRAAAVALRALSSSAPTYTESPAQRRRARMRHRVRSGAAARAGGAECCECAGSSFVPALERGGMAARLLAASGASAGGASRSQHALSIGSNGAAGRTAYCVSASSSTSNCVKGSAPISGTVGRATGRLRPPPMSSSPSRRTLGPPPSRFELRRTRLRRVTNAGWSSGTSSSRRQSGQPCRCTRQSAGSCLLRRRASNCWNENGPSAYPAIAKCHAAAEPTGSPELSAPPVSRTVRVGIGVQIPVRRRRCVAIVARATGG